ncbi:hypothetical protein SAMN02745248_00595 [Hathewaya proteolytica DSM 3090]|uniref:GIY-YIG catalytic domain-containing protein n=1 Tax=Hathewaya proteolytica DSM 3090 TaxID=1121331 RepID=A0A1M6L257_9CLOT|nr:hypothetical protein [Hathewaya proteolytica]SHJ65311.1 hypothetical protein SAMN02745248_00595 [Hathewaya proteolytica DSM 3090]
MEEILNYNSKLRRNEGVYAIHVVDAESDTNYVYIGSGYLGDRLSGNISKLKRNVHDCKVLQEKYNQFQNVKVEVLEVLGRSENETLFARDIEQDWIDYYRRIDGCVVLNKRRTFVNKKPYSYKLTEDDVREIRALYKNSKVSKEDIIKEYGISYSHLGNIIHYRKWKDVV